MRYISALLIPAVFLLRESFGSSFGRISALDREPDHSSSFYLNEIRSEDLLLCESTYSALAAYIAEHGKNPRYGIVVLYRVLLERLGVESFMFIRADNAVTKTWTGEDTSEIHLPNLNNLTDMEAFKYLEMLLDVLKPLTLKHNEHIITPLVADELVKSSSGLFKLVALNKKIYERVLHPVAVYQSLFPESVEDLLGFSEPQLNEFVLTGVYDTNHYIVSAHHALQERIEKIKTVIKSPWALSMLNLPRLDRFSDMNALNYLKLTLKVIKQVSEWTEDVTIDTVMESSLLQLIAENSILHTRNIPLYQLPRLCYEMTYKTSSLYTKMLRNALEFSILRTGDSVSESILKVSFDFVIGLHTNIGIQSAGILKGKTLQYVNLLIEKLTKDSTTLHLEQGEIENLAALRGLFLFKLWGNELVDDMYRIGSGLHDKLYS